MHFVIGYPMGKLDPPAELLTQDAVGLIARTAERAGIDAVAFTEHPAPPQSWRDEHGHDALDPFVALAFAAAATTRIRLLTFLAVLPYHKPFALAKTAATLDRLSGGRLILGAGVGYLAGEFDAMGVGFDERNELFDEAIDVLRLAWTGQPVDFQGRSFVAEETTSRPVPLSSPHPPIWIGGNSALTRRRVAQFADGWMPIPTTAEQELQRRTAQLNSIDRLGEQIRAMQEERERLGRLSPAAVKFMIKDIDPRTETDRYIERVRRLEEIGVDWLTLEIPNGSVSEAVEYLQWYDSELRPHIAGSDTGSLSHTPDEDRDAIVKLYHTYARALDQRRFGLLRDVFAQDVVVNYGSSKANGIEDLVTFMVESHRDIKDSHHRVLDFDIVVNGDIASCTASKRNTLTYSAIDRLEDDVERVVAGRYRDELVRTPTGWRITRRDSLHAGS